MLIVALVLAVIGLAALVTAVVSSNEIVAWVCIGVSAIGVILLVVDAVRDRQRRAAATAAVAGTAALVGTSTESIEFEESPADEEVIESVEPDLAVDSGPLSEQQAEIEAETEAAAEVVTSEVVAEDHPEEVVHDEPEFDTYSDDEPEYPPSAEESALNSGESEQR
jgi:NADH/NAD ratio-sensing transcriptional regulator Rex